MPIAVAVLLIHSFYASDCCDGKDCHPVSCDTIRTSNSGGWVYRYEGEDIFFTRNMMRVSEDGGCHVCLHGHDSNFVPSGLCIYLPPQT